MSQAYMQEYLDPTINLHRLLFVKMGENKLYDTFSMINKYMQTSEIRSKMDKGNWSALNKGWKQLWNDVDFSDCSSKKNDIDNIMLHWIADIYVTLQWKYNISSNEISRTVPAELMYKIYSPLHETSEKIACEKIYNKYFSFNQPR